MDLDKFIVQKPYLYHLTYKENLESIFKTGTLYSAEYLFKLSGDSKAQRYITTKRVEKIKINVEGFEIIIRDQHPISEVALEKCLTDGWTCSDYFKCLNKRIFMWSDQNRLQRHYDRYKKEKPSILKLETRNIIGLNSHVKFSRINSGATRPNSYLGGIAPMRGKDTFLQAENFELSVSNVAEVTFESRCILPSTILLANSPKGNWKQIKI